MKMQKPDPYVAAVKVVETIESCKTMEQFEGAQNLYRAYNRMFEGEWDWVYQDEFHEILSEKHNELNVNLQRQIQ